jgi:hypothetical protein
LQTRFAGAFEFLMLKDRKPFADMRRLFVYHNEWVRERSVSQDGGAMLRDGVPVSYHGVA